MPLLFIAIFLASFLAGSGVGYYNNNQQIISPGVNPSPTVNPTNACFPLVEPSVKISGNEIIIDSLPFDSGTDGGSGVFEQTAWQKVRDHLFGDQARIEPNGYNPNRRARSYILVKRDAPIPAWKVAFSSGDALWRIPNCWFNGSDCALNTSQSEVAFREMTRIGTLSSGAGDVWIATGWCSGDAANAQGGCDDPLVRNVIFVVSKQGRGPRSGRGVGVNREPDENPVSREDSWWKFNVYYDEAVLNQRAAARGASIPSNEDLPCWMRTQCIPDTQAPGDMMDPAGRKGKTDDTCISRGITPPPGAFNNPRFRDKLTSFANALKQVKILLTELFIKPKTARAIAVFPQFISGKGIIFDSSLGEVEKLTIIPNTYIITNTISLPASYITLGTINGIDGTVFNIYLANEELFVTSNVSPQDVYKYVKVYSDVSQEQTLKLGTFIPPQTKSSLPSRFTYEWYTPACKPAIYLYPEKETTLSVYVNPNGRLTETIPQYNSGWENVVAKPNGELLYKNTSYPYLYYEAEVKNVQAPQKGWVIKKENLAVFFDLTLAKLGLNKQEISDFKDYWIKKLSSKPYYFIGLISKEELNKTERVDFSVNPDLFIRVRFYFEGLDKPIYTTSPLLPEIPNREGFVAVDWGGMLVNGSCKDTLKSE